MAGASATTKDQAIHLTRANISQIFGERNVSKRLDAIAKYWGPDGEILFADGMGSFKTHGEISGMVDRILSMGAEDDRFRELGDVETLRDDASDTWITRLKWGVSTPDGHMKLAGSDIVTIVGGKIKSCYTFFDSNRDGRLGKLSYD